VHWDDPVSSSAPPELFGGLGDCSLAQVSHAQVVVRIAIVRIDLLSSCQLAHSFVDALLVQAGGAQVRVRIGIARVGLDRLLGMTALIDGRSRMRFALPTPMGRRYYSPARRVVCSCHAVVRQQARRVFSRRFVAMTAFGKEQDLLEVEKRFWDAMKRKDAQAAEQLTDDGCIVVGAQGVSAIDRKTMAKMTREGKWELQQYAFDAESSQVRFIADDVGIVAYKVTERVIVDGKTLPIEANDSSVWVRRNGEWLCALHTESLAGDPYGRDRQPR
jgi:hypothetical protein